MKFRRNLEEIRTDIEKKIRQNLDVCKKKLDIFSQNLDKI
jgi:BMFP domain-containing protein YqiC